MSDYFTQKKEEVSHQCHLDNDLKLLGTKTKGLTIIEKVVGSFFLKKYIFFRMTIKQMLPSA